MRGPQARFTVHCQVASNQVGPEFWRDLEALVVRLIAATALQDRETSPSTQRVRLHAVEGRRAKPKALPKHDRSGSQVTPMQAGFSSPPIPQLGHERPL